MYPTAVYVSVFSIVGGSEIQDGQTGEGRYSGDGGEACPVPPPQVQSQSRGGAWSEWGPCTSTQDNQTGGWGGRPHRHNRRVFFAKL